VARLLTLMWVTGLRVSEATYLKAGNIDLEQSALSLNAEGNSNRTKGGKPRPITFQPNTKLFWNCSNAPGRKIQPVTFSVTAEDCRSGLDCL